MITTESNAFVIDEAFYIPQLKRTRRIWVYIPQWYNDSDKRYPVIYMHDGQNLFDEATALGQEWQIDETLNSMLAETIIVGIDNSEYRMNEYNFNHHEEYGPGEGRQYMEFIVHTLKPFIDENFRTRPQREYTHLAGSSMGGLISFYGSIYFAETFGGAGIFSPAFWLVQDATHELREVAEKNKHLPQKFYFYGGAAEGSDMLTHISHITDLLKELPHYTINVEMDPEGAHNEFHWRIKFPNYYLWLKHQLTAIGRSATLKA
jgi:predicted alpha/beta superfamily hydrolase